MGIKDFGKLAKLRITATESQKFIEVMFNPESYSLTFSNVYRDYNTINTGFEKKEYTKTLPNEFKLKIIIDGTGVTDYRSAFFGGLTGTAKSVHRQVKDFKDLAWQPQNGQAPQLEISWGDLNLKCVLKEVTINYTLFDRDGNPLRAELDANFICDPEESKPANNAASDPTSKTGQTTDQTSKKTASGIVISAS